MEIVILQLEAVISLVLQVAMLLLKIVILSLTLSTVISLLSVMLLLSMTVVALLIRESHTLVWEFPFPTSSGTEKLEIIGSFSSC